MKSPLPEATLTQHTAFLGKTGSGKTSTAKLAVEQIVRSDPRARVCILDPIKSDWWGLTSSADGRRPGLPFHILGGPRGHVPLHSSAGKAIGELVGSGSLPLSIIDMADFKPGGLQEFFNDFAPALLRKMRGVVYLVIEEAHEFAPKERAGFGGESMTLHFAKKLATAGRSKGIRLLVLTQRTQALHNAILGSCDTMIAHRLTAPADQEPVKAWLKANVDKATFEKVSTSLASLKTGTAWLCSGEAQLAELREFPKITTFDNSATPTSSDREHHVTTAPVDQEKLRAIIGKAVEDAEADSPKVLRATIARLTAELAKKPAAVAAPAATINAKPEQIEAARKRGWDARGREDHELIKASLVNARIVERRLGAVIGEAADTRTGVRELIAKLEALPEIPADTAPAPSPGITHRQAAFAPAPKAATPRQPGPLAEGITGPQQRILDALAELATLGIRDASRIQVVFLAGYGHPNSKGFVNALGSLSTAGHVAYPRPGVVALTETGSGFANHGGTPLTSADLQRRVLELLGSAHGRILQPLIDAYPNQVSREELCTAAGYGHMNSKGFVNAIGRLRSLGFIDYPSKGQVVALPVLFVE